MTMRGFIDRSAGAWFTRPGPDEIQPERAVSRTQSAFADSHFHVAAIPDSRDVVLRQP